jgi:hypothetical protein
MTGGAVGLSLPAFLTAALGGSAVIFLPPSGLALGTFSGGISTRMLSTAVKNA